VKYNFANLTFLHKIDSSSKRILKTFCLFKKFVGGETTIDSYVNISEALTSTGWTQLASLPVTIALHCLTLINSTMLIAIGGMQESPLYIQF
jgi:hypothetical protein